jgi:hypothetical protein
MRHLEDLVMKARYIKHMLFSFVIYLPSLAACSQSATPDEPSTSVEETSDMVAAETSSSMDSSCDRESEMTFEDWSNWTKVNDEPITGHDSEWTDVYVDELAEATYLSATAPFPECARIVKAEYSSATAADANKLAIMVKMSAGYDPEHADWWYGVYDRTGTKSTMQGKIAFCIDCHDDATETDYLFSKEVLEASKE